jgi:hypothetical protein
MLLDIGQKWVSKEHPYEDFEIYDGTYDERILGEKDLSYDTPFFQLPESAKIFFWKRINEKEFNKFLDEHGKKNSESTYPFAWFGESKKDTLIRKINKYNMMEL